MDEPFTAHDSHHATPSPPVMSANLTGPVADPHDLYRSFGSDSNSSTATVPPTSMPQLSVSAGAAPDHHTASSRSFSPTGRRQLRAASGPAVTAANHALNGARSHPVLLPRSRQQASVKDLANRFNQAAVTGGGRPTPSLAVPTATQRSQRSLANNGRTSRSPVSGKMEPGMGKLHKRRPAGSKSPSKSPATSFDTASSLSSAGTLNNNKNPPLIAARKAISPSRNVNPISTKPLFGELTADGWHGNFDINGYGQLPPIHPGSRRQSEGSVALGHGRSQSHTDMPQPMMSPTSRHALHHRRSRSDMDTMKPLPAPSMPNLHAYNVPPLYPTPPSSGQRNVRRRESPASRIPVVSAPRQSHEPYEGRDPFARPASAMSNTSARNRLSKSPTRKHVIGKENAGANAAPRNRYQPPPLSTPLASQTLSAKIVAPLPKTSPPLRSSRPRQPVSSATTSASRARAADRFPGSTSNDGRRPSEQWLGKPYDAQTERTRRRIPELGKLDFAERRARIQKAISQNLEESQSQENLRSQSRAQSSRDVSGSSVPGAEDEGAGTAFNSVDQHQADEMNRETDAIDVTQLQANSQPKGLSVDTSAVPQLSPQDHEPTTAHTEFEMDESPVLGRAPDQYADDGEATAPGAAEEQPPTLLTSATYRGPPANTRPATPPSRVEMVEKPVPPLPQVSELSDSTLRQDDFSTPGEQTVEPIQGSSDDSPSDIEDRWGLGSSFTADQGSIRIMLDDIPGFPSQETWSERTNDDLNTVNGEVHQDSDAKNDQPLQTLGPQNEASAPEQHVDESMVETPRKRQIRKDALQTASPSRTIPLDLDNDATAIDATLTQAIDQYQTTNTIAPEMLQYLQNHSVDLQRMSANGGSDAIMIQNLLDSMFDLQQSEAAKPEEPPKLQPFTYEIPAVTPDTPSDADMAAGTAVVYSNETSFDVTPQGDEDDEDFQAKIRKADEEWERQQHEDNAPPGEDAESRPPPPPKDAGYTPRSSVGPNSATFPPGFTEGLRISTSGDHAFADTFNATGTFDAPATTRELSATTTKPLPPTYAPPPPPSAGVYTYDTPDIPPLPAAYSERASSELSPRIRRSHWGASGSSRPSTDSQRAPGPPLLQTSQSMTSVNDSVNTSFDGIKLSQSTSQTPEQKRLQKRRHIIKELLDTENTYHQDLKIIEDIYKATVADLVSTEDKKTLFSNCDEIERFSIHFYDELRKAVLPVYVPPKHMRWGNKRNSYSTTQSDGTGQTSVTNNDAVVDEKDRATSVGQCFLDNLQRMDHVYGIYLRNHDSANQRLAALKNTPTVKCWLDECHNNASDITSAWDLDSLLVKPTQRVSKYPMLLQQLLETTPADHPDHEALKTSAKDSVGMLMRINEAKKRADIVDQIINRKGKESDVRSGIAKAFGRRTEKLKERVGIAEAFQDTDFDDLAHKFGGHFIRLQICMRDVQDYMHRIDRAMDLVSNYAASLELFTDVGATSLPEIESKWRRYAQAIREIISVAFAEHKNAVNKRVIGPMITCIRLHDGPQNAINKRKKRIVDYARCKSIEKRGEKPDKKTVEASEMYIALNDQLKIDLPKLYTLTASLVQACLACFLNIQLTWYDTWERKLRPVLEAADIPASIQQIEPAFRPDYDLIKNKLTELAICNGSALADSANFLSPASTLVADSDHASSKRPSTLDGSKRTISVGSESSPVFLPQFGKRYSNGNTPQFDPPPRPSQGRIRSQSSVSTKGTMAQQTPGSSVSMSRQWSNTMTPTSSFSTSRPQTANPPPNGQGSQQQSGRPSADQSRSPRPSSATTYFTAQHDTTPDPNQRGALFQSALPPDMASSSRPASAAGRQSSGGLSTSAAPDTPVLFVCASLFEFSIDKTRREGGFPYLTYSQGEVFDVVAQKGELWLAKNQDDSDNALGWIWEQHFVILSQD